MSSNELAKIGPETLALYGTQRKIYRESYQCSHWRGEEWPTSGPTRHVAFATENMALRWVNGGPGDDVVQELTAEEAGRGCSCRKRAKEPVFAPYEEVH